MGKKANEPKKTKKKLFPIALATAVACSASIAIPKAYAVSDVEIDADDSDVAGEESDYTISFYTDEGLSSGDIITLTFDEEFEIDSKIEESDVDVNGDEPDKVVYNSSKNTLKITVSEEIDADDSIEVTISDAITNPDEADEYDIEVETTEDSESDYGSIEIVDEDDDDDSSDDEFDVQIDDDEEGAETSYELGEIDLGSDELETGEWVTVTFPDSDMVPSDIDTEDVEINGYEVSDIEIDDEIVKLEVPDDADTDDELTIEFLEDAGITNPDADDNYVIKVKYAGETYTSEEFEITDGGSSSGSASGDIDVSLSDKTAGARSSYTVDADLGKTKLGSSEELKLQFPSSMDVPSLLSTSDFTINGKTPSKASAWGNTVYLTTPSSFSSTSDVTIVVKEDAFLTNPTTAGTYSVKLTVDGKTFTSNTFSITSAGSVTPVPTPTPTPVPTPVPVNNSTATVSLTNTALSGATGVNVGLKGLGQPLQKNSDFIEVVFPAGYKLPAFIQPASVTVNGIPASFVALRGQNVLVYPGQDLAAGVPVNVSINANAKILNPAAKNVYNISIYSSEEKAALVTRAVGVGGAVPPSVQPQPNPAIPANAASIKVGVASFTLQGKSYPLTAAPYLSNSNTMVPAQYFKEGLSLSTVWSNKLVSVSNGSKSVKMTVGSNIATVGQTQLTMPAKVELKNGMPMIPVKWVADQLGYKTGWDAKTSTTYVYK